MVFGSASHTSILQVLDKPGMKLSESKSSAFWSVYRPITHVYIKYRVKQEISSYQFSCEQFLRLKRRIFNRELEESGLIENDG